MERRTEKSAASLDCGERAALYLYTKEVNEMMNSEIRTVTIEQAKDVLRLAAKVNKPVLLIGDPGVGKTSIVREVANEIGKSLVTLLGSLLEPTDIGGVPFLVDGVVKRLPLEEIRNAAAKPSVLLLDELTTAPRNVQAAELRLMLERVAGGTRLHPDTVVFAAANPSEQAPGGVDLSAPMINRMITLRLVPTLTESVGWFLNLGEKGSMLRSAGVEIGATALAAGEIMQIVMPSARSSDAAPWGSPRAWGVVADAAAAVDCDWNNSALRSVIEGSVGRGAASKFFAVKDIRDELTSVRDILDNPKDAPVPSASNLQASIAMCSNVAVAAQENSWAAWAYASRLKHREARVAMLSILQNIDNSPYGLPFEEDGLSAIDKMTRENKRAS